MPETMRILTENFAKEFTLKCELLVKTLDGKNSERLSQCLCQCLYILKSVCLFYVRFFLYISQGSDKENLFNNQELLHLGIIPLFS